MKESVHQPGMPRYVHARSHSFNVRTFDKGVKGRQKTSEAGYTLREEPARSIFRVNLTGLSR